MAAVDLILDHLNFQGFTYLGAGKFKIINTPSEWFSHLIAQNSQAFDKTVTTEYQLGNFLPYIDNFLLDAENVWRLEIPRAIESGIWTEKGDDGKEYQLVAKAFSANNQAYLVIENISEQFEERHRVYQRMRELALTNERLINELNRRQRILQKEIRKSITADQSLEQIDRQYQHHTAAVMICQSDGTSEVVNNALVNIYQASSKAEQSLQQVSLLDRWLNEAEEQYPEIKRVIESGKNWEGNFATIDFSGEQKWIHLSISPVLAKDLSVQHYVCIAYDLSEFRQGEQSNDEFMEYDLTTNLPNRRHFWHALENKLASREVKSTNFVLLCVDIDDFKQISDEFGHHAADEVLNKIAGRLNACIKSQDFVANLGGDEFAIILDAKLHGIDAQNVAERILSMVNNPLTVEDTSVKLSCSIGMTVFSGEKINAHELFKQADLALFYAKGKGKNCIQIYHSQLEHHPQRMRRLQELRSAFMQQEFDLHFQPQLSTREDGLIRLEALLRWNHPNKGIIQAGEFITLLEESGLIVPIGAWIVQQVCRYIRELSESDNIMAKQIRVAVNISAKQLQQEEFFNELMTAITDSQIDPEQLELEITEHCFMGDSARAMELLQQVRKQGMLVTLDDFGSGYSSLSYLKKLPVDLLKIDSSFVVELPENRESVAIVSSIIKLAHALNLKVVAEGVENRSQLKFLLENHCDYVQGFYFSPAVTINQIGPTLESLTQIQLSIPA